MASVSSMFADPEGGCAESNGAGLLKEALVELEHVGMTALAFGTVVVLPAVGVATAVLKEEYLTGNKAVLASGPSLGVATVTSITLFLFLCRFGSGVVVVFLERNVEGDAIIMRDRGGSCFIMIPPPDTGEDSTSNTLEDDFHDSGLDVSEVTAEIVVLADWPVGVES